jgi:hypothetical protein
VEGLVGAAALFGRECVPFGCESMRPFAARIRTASR